MISRLNNIEKKIKRYCSSNVALIECLDGLWVAKVNGKVYHHTTKQEATKGYKTVIIDDI